MSVEERDKGVQHLLVHRVHLRLRGIFFLLHRNGRSEKQRHISAEGDGKQKSPPVEEERALRLAGEPFQHTKESNQLLKACELPIEYAGTNGQPFRMQNFASDCFLCTGNGGNGRKTVSACLAHGEVHEHSVLAK